jgi:anti-sigma B factor antagonist
MDLISKESGGVSILEVSGRFDAHTALTVREWLLTVTAATPANIVINLEGVEFIDSTGLSTLVQGMKRAREMDGDIRLSGMRRSVRMIFELTRLDKVFETYITEDEAVRAFTI